MIRVLYVLVAVAVILMDSSSISTAQVIPQEIKKVVTFIFLADEKGDLRRDAKNNPIPYGTGFFVIVKGSNGIGGYGYLVTAKHVLKDDNGNDLTKIYI